MKKFYSISFFLIFFFIVFFSLTFVVDQRKFGVVYQLGQIQRVIAEPGLNWKFPQPIQNVIYIDKRLLLLDGSDIESMLTAEKKRVVIDWYVRWRITDPALFIRNVGVTEEKGGVQLSKVVRNAFQQEVGKLTVSELLSSHRDDVMVSVKDHVSTVVDQADKAWGIQIVDVRINRIDYAETITESVYKRMEAERFQVAEQLRSTGAAEAEQIRASADRQSEVTLANAYKDAQKIKGEGDAEAAKIYSSAFAKDPGFASFYRSMESYKSGFVNKNDFLILDPSSNDYFKYFKKPNFDSGSQLKVK